MHRNITNKFKKWIIFGFTGTPIFTANAQTKKGIMQTTGQTFGERLHTYTIVNAINDKNVLPFRYEYIGRIDIYDDFKRKSKVDSTDITEDIVFEMELIKQIEVNIDYILALVKKYHDSNMKDKEVLVTINKAIMASPDLRNKKDLILAFIDSLNTTSDVYSDFENFMNSKKKEELDKIIEDENLNVEETYKFIKSSFEKGRVETDGTEISSMLPAMDMFSKDKSRAKKKNAVIDKLLDFFDKFFSITSNSMFNKKNIEYKIDEDKLNSESMVAEDSEEYKNG